MVNPDNHFTVTLKLKLPFINIFVIFIKKSCNVCLSFFHVGYFFLRLPAEQVDPRKHD